MKRHNARIEAIIILYNINMNSYQVEEINDELLNTITDDVLSVLLDNDYQVEIETTFCDKLVRQTLDNLVEIDEIISSNLVKWTIDRLSYLDRAIIRSAVCEMKYFKTPKAVVINEYLNITRDYADDEHELQVKFNNRLLDNIAKVIYE